MNEKWVPQACAAAKVREREGQEAAIDEKLKVKAEGERRSDRGGKTAEHEGAEQEIRPSWEPSPEPVARAMDMRHERRARARARGEGDEDGDIVWF